MWSPPGITEPTLIRRYGLMMSDLQGLITKSTSVTFQHIITPSFPPFFSLAATSDKRKRFQACAALWSPLVLRPLRETEKNCAEGPLYHLTQAKCSASIPMIIVHSLF